MVNLVWLRNDLRLADNPALHHACQDDKPIVVIYIATPKQWQLHDDAAIKLDFWRRNLQSMQADLASCHIEYRYFQVDSYQQIPELMLNICQQWHVSDVFYNHEYPLNEQARDQAVEQHCLKQGITCHGYHDQLLIAPKSLRTQTGEPYKVFTPFSKVAKQRLAIGVTLYPVPDKQKPHELALLEQSCELNDIAWPIVSQDKIRYWPAGEQAALERLSRFCQNTITHYHQQRDIPSLRGTSKLSAYLASGVISVRQCWQLSITYCEPSDGVTTWQNELLWRDFYKHVLIDFPHVSKHQAFKPHTDAIAWRHDESDLVAWQQGRTGFPLVDAAMRQLLEVGWMHNRLRMVTAMFLTKHLLIDWRLGEKWFMQHLIDGELAANNGGWQWSASTGTDAVPYFRIFNPISQSVRYDPEGVFIRHYLPELSSLSNTDIHQPRASQYCEPIVNLAEGRERALATFKQLK